MDVLPAERGAVEAVPEPEQRLHPGEPRRIDVGVVLRLERDVAGIEREQRDPRRRRGRRVGEALLVVAEPGVVELVQHIAGDAVPIGTLLTQSTAHLVEPGVVGALGGLGEGDGSQGQKYHGEAPLGPA